MAAFDALTPASICRQARTRLNTPSTVTFPPEALLDLYNAACERWAVDTQCLAFHAVWDTVNVPEGTLVPGTSDPYTADQRHDLGAFISLRNAFPGSTAHVRRVTLRPSDKARRIPLEFIDFEQLPYTWRDDAPSTPRCWSMFDAITLILYPQPSIGVTGGLEIDGFHVPDWLDSDPGAGDGTGGDLGVGNDIEHDFNPEHCPFMRDHREGLVRALCLLMCESNYEDPAFAARIPLFAVNYQAEVDRAKTANRPVRPYRMGGQGRRPIGPAAYDPLTGDRHDARQRW